MYVASCQVVAEMICQQFPEFDTGSINALLNGLALVLQVGYILFSRWYFVLIVFGFMVYATTLNDSLAKTLVVFGVFSYILSPFLAEVMDTSVGIEAFLHETSFGAAVLAVSDIEVMSVLLAAAEAVGAICVLSGAVMYLTKPSRELEVRGRSLVVRALVLFVCLSFLSLTFL
ncbi:MAG: hypothetical protein DRO93_00955 [Candidatus Thorarchaeota archaeon]|nr:MAG: hypothetical protein DRO93_00955 [Candidatus Thorarchaeota archaeon]